MNRAQILADVKALIVKESDGQIQESDIQVGPDSLRRLGLNSLATLRVLVAVEDEFGIEWDDDVDEAVMSDLQVMCDHIADKLGVPA
ncbi:acyl carrier protein [Nocardia fluminea]|uniref:acyl carrier protein n=1 Tax=Nocardia fluminea TaxID=134984 RepID=UPI0033D7478D